MDLICGGETIILTLLLNCSSIFLLSVCMLGMLVSLLDQNLDQLGNIGDLPVSSLLPMLHDEVFAVNEDSTALSAFKLMTSKGIRGVAVTNSSGEIVDSVSVRDLRALGDEENNFYDRLQMTVKQFKAKAREVFKLQTPVAPVTITPNDSINSLIKRFDDGNLHRVFVIDPTGKLAKRTITQRSLLKFILVRAGLQGDTLQEC